MEPITAFVKRYYEIFDADRSKLTVFYVSFPPRSLGRGDRY